MPEDTIISLQTQIPEDLHYRIQEFLDDNPHWHYDDFATCALALFLMQLGDSNTAAARLYLDRMYQRLSREAA